MPQRHLASHAIAVGVDMRGEHDAAAGREHRGDLGGRARALGGNRDSVRGHGIKINKRRQETTSTRSYGPDLAPMNERRCGFVPVTTRRPLTESVFCCSMNLPGTSTETGMPETFTTPVTWIESGSGCVYLPRMLSGVWP